MYNLPELFHIKQMGKSQPVELVIFMMYCYIIWYTYENGTLLYSIAFLAVFEYNHSIHTRSSLKKYTKKYIQKYVRKESACAKTTLNKHDLLLEIPEENV